MATDRTTQSLATSSAGRKLDRRTPNDRAHDGRQHYGRKKKTP